MFEKESKKSDTRFNEVTNLQSSLKSTVMSRIQKIESKIMQLFGPDSDESGQTDGTTLNFKE